jgi:GntR family transcriptional repressor for pyruvate dehydrogenase complex
MEREDSMFESVKAQRISDEIVRQIRDALFVGKLRTGDKLPTERELSVQFKTSRTSVREALRSLEHEGVIQVKKGASGGIFVIDVDHWPVTKSLQTLLQLRKISINDIAEVRLIFEPHAARLAAERASRDDIRELEEVVERTGEAVRTRELPRSHDLKFHKLIARATGNLVLEMLAESMLEVASKAITELHPSIDTLAHVLTCHQRVAEAVRKRDGALAFKAMHEHIIDVQARLAKQATNHRRTAKRR